MAELSTNHAATEPKHACVATLQRSSLRLSGQDGRSTRTSRTRSRLRTEGGLESGSSFRTACL
jgi:hypothetical protein